MKEFYTLTEVADIVKVSKRTLYTYIDNGTLKAVKFGRDWRVNKENLEDFLEKGAKGGKKQK